MNIDLKDFFPSISFEQVFHIFYYYGYSKKIAFYLARLCTYKDFLPQGSPCSPYLSNIVCLKLDKRISKLSLLNNAIYTRYADDITISGNNSMKYLLPTIEKIINEEGFNINTRKTRFMYKTEKQMVTGLIVNDTKLHVNKKFKSQFEKDIYYCKRFGVKSHKDYLNIDYSFFKEHMYGKAYFVKMVEKEIGEHYLKMLDEIIWDY